MQVWTACGGMEQREWPDGGPLMQQPCIVVEMFELITEEVDKKCRETTQ